MDSFLLPTSASSVEPSAAQALRPSDGLNQAEGRNTPEAKLKRLNRLKQVSAEVESIFVQALLKALRQSVPRGGLWGRAAGADVYESMSDQQVAVHLARGQGLGLGELIFNQLVRREDLEAFRAENPNLAGLTYQKRVPPDLMPRPGLQAAKPDPEGKVGEK